MPNTIIKYNAPRFDAYNIPNGTLIPRAECHALWYYYLLAKKALEEWDETIVLEGTPQKEPEYLKIFQGVITLYGCSPEVMIKFWPYVDLQADKLNMARLPYRDEIRFNSVTQIRTQ